MRSNFPRRSRILMGIAAGAALLAAALSVWAVAPHRTQCPPRGTARASGVIKLLPARFQAAPPEAPPVTVEVDATRTSTDRPADLTDIWDAIRSICPTSNPVIPELNDTPWVAWGRMKSPPAPVSISTDAGVTAYAVHSARGTTLCLINRTPARRALTLRLRLPRGVYKAERLTYTPPVPAAQTDPAAAPLPLDQGRPGPARDTNDARERNPFATIQMERLQGRSLNATTLVRKPCDLQPRQIAFYRYTDVAHGARAALNETYDSLHAMAGGAPGPAGRLRHILDEGAGERGSLAMGNGKSLSARLSGVHRLLLLTAQVLSMQRNYQRRHAVDSQRGAAVMTALERLTDALAETSAGLLELLPQITVHFETEPAPGSPAPDPGAPHFVVVTLSLTNLGRQSPAMVKLGLDTAALPRGVVCVPDDPAYFGAVQPGQSVRATFRVRCPAGTALLADRCGGDVSYFVSGTPAHLRIRAW